MKFRDAVNKCPPGGYIARDGSYHSEAPDDFKFWHDDTMPFECVVAWQDQIEHDWESFARHE